MHARRWLLTVAVVFLAGATARAQGIGICNPAKVFADMNERKAIEDKMKKEQANLEVENKTRQRDLQELQQQRDQLKPDSAMYKEKNELLLNKAVEYRVWLEMQKAQMARSEKEQIRNLYDKIVDACKQVAEQKKLDLVLAVRRPELPTDMDPLTPDQLRQGIMTNDVLYSNAKLDMTDEVILLLNKNYATPAGGAAAPAPAPAPTNPK